MDVDLDLLRRHNEPLPRYTSYPTAPHFHEGVGPETLRDAARRPDAAPAHPPLSLYVHLPFCRELCYYCGCNMRVTHDRDRIEAYLDVLKQEIDTTAALLPAERPVTQIHWGGGTPTYLSPAQIRALGTHLRDRFRVAPDAEVSLEADPRGLTEAHVAAAREVGFTRMSVGVQSFDRRVQEAINRVQPERLTRRALRWAREQGMSSINADLVYGLPHQTPETFGDTLATILDLAPDRIALYSYAHVPSAMEHQRLLPEEALPTPATRLRLFKQALETLTGRGGYQFIGMDHFAQPDDALAVAQRENTLWRNFQGYSTRAGADVFAFGVSGIHQFGGLYAQNTKHMGDYREAVEEGGVPVERGVRLGPDDRLRRHVIMQLMCNFRLDKARVAAAFDVDVDAYFAEAFDRLRPLADDGLVDLGPDAIVVPPSGRLLIRNIVSAFDAYLHDDAPEAADDPVYSESV